MNADGLFDVTVWMFCFTLHGSTSILVSSRKRDVDLNKYSLYFAITFKQSDANNNNFPSVRRIGRGDCNQSPIYYSYYFTSQLANIKRPEVTIMPGRPKWCDLFRILYRTLDSTQLKQQHMP